MKFFGAFILVSLLFAQSLFALPAVHPAYIKEYEVTRKNTHFRELDLISEEYKHKSEVVRAITYHHETEIELYLTNEISGYGFFSPNSVRTEMEKFIERIQNSDIAASEKHLVLGDAYHWLGHVYEEKGELTLAYEAYVRSHVHYQKTPLKRSPRINKMLIVQEHGEFHLKDIKKTILSIASTPGFTAAFCSRLFH